MSEGRKHRSLRQRGLLAVAGIGAAVLGAIFRSEQLLEAWLFIYVVLAGFAIGGLGLLMIGHLLGEYWLGPVRDELEAMALTMPLLAILALPIGLGLDPLFAWASGVPLDIPPLRKSYLEPTFFLLRSAGYLAIWAVLAWWVARPGEHRGRSALGLALLAPTAALAGVDWVMSRDPHWWSSLFGFAFAMTQLLPALAGAVLLTILRPDRPDQKRLRSLERALMTLSLAVLWLWFVQFLTIWMTNLPDEVAWYIARYENWGWAMLWVTLPALAAGILALLPVTVGGFLLRSAVILLLIQHVAHMLWLVNPETNGPLWPGLLVVVGLSALWLFWFASALAGRQNIGYGRSP